MAIPTSERRHQNAGDEHHRRNRKHAVLGSVTTPDMMVSGVPLPSMRTVMMGSRFAGR